MYQLTDHSLNAGLPDGIFSNRKIPIWVNFGGHILWLFGQLPALWFSLCPYMSFVVIWYSFLAKNLATLLKCIIACLQE
jgi:hypothetical protein